jgi:hypothetical protein
MTHALTLGDIERAFRAGWSLETCDPVDRAEWSPDNPARGQCGVTALAVSDLLGGVLVEARVIRGDEDVEFHYWNRLPSGLEIDLTREQYRCGETFTVLGTVEPAVPNDRIVAGYELLCARIAAVLGPAGRFVGRWAPPRRSD